MTATSAPQTTDIQRSIDAVWRIESARLIGALTRITRDVGLAEDLAQDALVAALERWPQAGIPSNPSAWLMAAAKNRAIDNLRRNKLLDRKHEQLSYELEGSHQLTPDDINTAIDSPVGDDLLRLIFISCHPILSPESRVALTLRLLGGLTTDEIARAFLLAEPTVAQRIVRAKRTLSEAKVPFEVPRGDEFIARLASVLQVVYLVFNEGYSATAGDDWTRPTLCEDALRLGRILAELVPGEPEVHGLISLMEIQASRLNARVTPTGEPILLLDQDRSRWDQLLIGRGLSSLSTAQQIIAQFGVPPGPYVLQAAIAASHARAATAADTDWNRIAALYSELNHRSPSPIIELNRAVAVSMAQGPAVALPLVDALTSEPALKTYHLLPSVRGDLLLKLGRHAEARAEFERAATLTRNARERTFLLNRAQTCMAAHGSNSPSQS
jgi:RNA polymerase sigma factor (sigma-70 family)